MSILESLKPMKQFLDSHPKEVVFLDFNHLYGFQNYDQVLQFAMLVQELFGSSKTVPFDHSISEITLQSLWQKGQQVWIFFFSGSISQYDVWSSTQIISPWAKTADDNRLINFLEANYHAGRVTSTHYVHQGVMTINAGSVILNLFGGLRSFVKKGSQKYVNWLKGKALAKPGQRPVIGINICIMDFIEEFDYVNTVLRLNR